MPVYMIVEIEEVTDKDGYGRYIREVPKIIAKFGGRYLARGEKVEAVCGEWRSRRLIIVEFASRDKFDAWWNSPEYRAIAPLRENSTRSRAIVVEGI